MTLPQHHFPVRIGHDGHEEEKVGRTLALFYELDVVIEHKVREDRLERPRGEKSPRTAFRAPSALNKWSHIAGDHVPRVSSVSERKPVDRGVRELMRRAVLVVLLSHVRKTEWVKDVGPRILLFVVMD